MSKMIDILRNTKQSYARAALAGREAADQGLKGAELKRIRKGIIELEEWVAQASPVMDNKRDHHKRLGIKFDEAYEAYYEEAI